MYTVPARVSPSICVLAVLSIVWLTLPGCHTECTQQEIGFIGKYRWGKGFGSVAQVKLGDFDGDGLTDVAQFSGDGKSFVWRSTGTQFKRSPPSPTQAWWGTGHGNPAELLLGNFDGNATTDVIQFSGDGASHLWLSDGAKFVGPMAGSTGHGSIAEVRLGRFDAGNITDVIQFAADGRSHVWLSKEVGPYQVKLENPTEWGSGHGGASEVLLGDFDADGMTDVVQITANGNSFVWRSNGASFDPPGNAPWGTGHGNAAEVRTGDFNGDGATDLIQFTADGRSFVWLSVKTGFVKAGQWGAGHGDISEIFLGNFDDNASTDVAQFTADGKSFVWLSTGDEFRFKGQWGSGHGTSAEIRLGRFDANSTTDVAQFTNSGEAFVWLTGASEHFVRVQDVCVPIPNWPPEYTLSGFAGGCENSAPGMLKVKARVYYPARAQRTPSIACGRPFPLVVYTTGNRDSNEGCQWVPPTPEQEDYLRLDATFRALAAEGMIVISVDGLIAWTEGMKAIILLDTVAFAKSAHQNAASFLHGAIRLSHVALAGHSTAGAGVGVALKNLDTSGDAPDLDDVTFRAIALLAPRNEGHHLTSVTAPALILHGTSDVAGSGVGVAPVGAYGDANPPKHLAVVNGANHFGYTELCLANNDAPSTVGGATNQQAHLLQQRTAREYLRAFFSHYLLERPTWLDYLTQASGTQCQQPAGQPLCPLPKRPFNALVNQQVAVDVCSCLK